MEKNWILVFEETQRLWEDGKISLSHNAKKTQARVKTTAKVKSEEELNRLAKISAKRDIKNNFSRKLFKKNFTNLNDSQKERIKTKMKEKSVKVKIDKLTEFKTKEKDFKQKEKIARKEASLAKDKETKAKHLANAKKYRQEASSIKANYADLIK